MAIDKNTITKEAQKFAAKGQFDLAIAEWKKLLSETPDDPNIFNTIGDLCLKKQSKSEAVDAYMRAANLLATDGFTSKAIALYKKVLNIDAAKIDAHLALGDMNAEKGLTGNALENFKHVADYYIQHKQTAKALDIYQKMADLNPANVAFQVKLGDMYAKEGIKDKSARAYIAAADVHVSKSEFKDARQLFEKVLALDPDNIAVYHKAGIVYFKEGKFVEACKAFKHAFESGPANLEIAELYIEALARAGKDAEAEQVLRKLLASDPDHAGLREKLYNLYLTKKDYEKAIIEAATLSEHKVAKGEQGAAEELLKGFVAASPTYPPGRQKLAEFYISVNHAQDAAAELLQAAELYAGEGDLRNARAVLTQAVELAPNMPEAATRLKALEEPAAAAPLSGPEFTSEFTTEEEPPASVSSPGIPEPRPAPVLETPAPPSAAAVVPTDSDPAVMEAVSEADVLVKYGLTAKAIEQLETLCSKFPESPRIRIKLRDLYHELGETDKAVRHALLAVALYTKFGLEDQATQVLRATHEMAPGNSAIVARLGRMPAAPQAPAAMAPEEVILQVLDPELPEMLPAEPELTPEPMEEIAAPPEQSFTGEILFEGLESHIPHLDLETPVLEKTSPVAEPLPPPEQPVEPEPPVIEAPSLPEPPAPAPPTAEEKPPEPPEQAVIAPSASVDVSEIWAEAEFYFQQGLFDEAKKHYTQIIALTPGDRRAIGRLTEISREEDETLEFTKLADAVEGLEGSVPAQAADGELAASDSDNEAVRALMQEIQQLKQQPAAPPPPLEKKKTPAAPRQPEPIAAKPAAPPPAAAAPPVSPVKPKKDEDYDFFDLGEELQRDAASTAVPDKAQPSFAARQEENQSSSEDFFDLAAELRDDLGSLPVPARTAAVPADEQSLDDIFEEFKKGVEQQSVKEDADTHYNLGVAYKEMGLLDDAIAEFILTPEDESKFVQSRYMLGLCYLEKEEYQNAIGEFQNALDYSETLGIDTQNQIEMRYDLGLAYQGAGNVKNAIDEFQKVADEDRGFRDVSAKLKELHKGDFISLDQLKDDIEKEISSKFLKEGVRIEREEKTRKNERVKI